MSLPTYKTLTAVAVALFALSAGVIAFDAFLLACEPYGYLLLPNVLSALHGALADSVLPWFGVAASIATGLAAAVAYARVRGIRRRLLVEVVVLLVLIVMLAAIAPNVFEMTRARATSAQIDSILAGFVPQAVLWADQQGTTGYAHGDCYSGESLFTSDVGKETLARLEAFRGYQPKYGVLCAVPESLSHEPVCYADGMHFALAYLMPDGTYDCVDDSGLHRDGVVRPEGAACPKESSDTPEGNVPPPIDLDTFVPPTPGWETEAVLSEAEAQAIAEESCIKGGDALASGGTYNPNSKTWWFDANLNATREGCNPACVVSVESKTAEINWRCTGLIVP